jgi:hypothetical protein
VERRAVNVRKVMLEARAEHGITFERRGGQIVLGVDLKVWGAVKEPDKALVETLRDNRDEILTWLRVEEEMEAARRRISQLLKGLSEPKKSEWEFADVLPMSAVRSCFSRTTDPERARLYITAFEAGWRALITGADREEVKAIVRRTLA